MEIEKAFTDLGDVKVRKQAIHDGQQVLVRFPNNWGASVIHHSRSYGVELAVIRFLSDDMNDWGIRYDTGVTSDVLGWLDEESLLKALHDIKALHPDRQSIPGRHGTAAEQED